MMAIKSLKHTKLYYEIETLKCTRLYYKLRKFFRIKTFQLSHHKLISTTSQTPETQPNYNNKQRHSQNDPTEYKTKYFRLMKYEINKSKRKRQRETKKHVLFHKLTSKWK